MKKIIEYLEKEEYQVVEYNYKETKYILTPMFIVIKDNNEYLISFDITADKSDCINIYIDFCYYFKESIIFNLYQDCVMKVNEYDIVEYIYFGNDAKSIYYEEIYNSIEEQKSIPKNATWH